MRSGWLPHIRFTLIAVVVTALPLTSHAGMAMPRLSDIAASRLDVISFFVVGYLALAWIYQRIWNSLTTDFPRMPRISYRGALGALVVCGLFIYVVLTMISGARELLTPGAWARSGILYTIREPEKDPQPWLDTARRNSLENLRAALWRYAQENGGSFPPNREGSEFPSEHWKSVDPNGLLLVYFPGLKADSGRSILAHEPGSFGAKRFVLLTSGEVVQMKTEELASRVREQIKQLDSSIPMGPRHE